MNASVTPPSQPVPVRAAGRKRRSWGQRFLLLLGVFSTMATLSSAGVLAWSNGKFSAIPTINISNVEQTDPGEAANWLLVGTDSREGIDADDPNAAFFLGEPVSGKRTDTMILARVDPEHQRIDLLSLPRDLYLPISGTSGSDRINTAFIGDGGPERLVATIEDNFSVEINHYAEVNFVGFQDIVDAMDGVPIWFDKPMRDAGSGLNVERAGCWTLNGSEALAFARARHLEYFEGGGWHSDPTGDLGRTARQQYFLRRVVDTAAAKLDITEIGTINSLLDTGGQNLILDEGAQPSDLLTLGKTFADLSGEQIVGHALPVDNVRIDDKAVLTLQDELAEPIFDIFRGVVPADASTPTTAPPLEISVMNGSGVAGQATTVASGLEQAGFAINAVGNVESGLSETTLRYGPGMESVAEAAAAAMPFRPLLEADPNAIGVTLVTGADYAERSETGGFSAAETTAPPAATEAPPAPVNTADTQVGVVPEASPEGTACG